MAVVVMVDDDGRGGGGGGRVGQRTRLCEGNAGIVCRKRWDSSVNSQDGGEPTTPMELYFNKRALRARVPMIAQVYAHAWPADGSFKWRAIATKTISAAAR